MLTRIITIRTSVRVHSKKGDFVAPVDPPKREPLKKVNPIKKFIMDVFKIEEIDYEKFNKENIWAIRPDEDKE